MSRSKNKVNPANPKISPKIPYVSKSLWNRYRLWIFLFWVIGLIAILSRWGNF